MKKNDRLCFKEGKLVGQSLQESGLDTFSNIQVFDDSDIVKKQTLYLFIRTLIPLTLIPVSYTHLDVYKRQP